MCGLGVSLGFLVSQKNKFGINVSNEYKSLEYVTQIKVQGEDVTRVKF